jgi:hypothetical protein
METANGSVGKVLDTGKTLIQNMDRTGTSIKCVQEKPDERKNTVY